MIFFSFCFLFFFFACDLILDRGGGEFQGGSEATKRGGGG